MTIPVAVLAVGSAVAGLLRSPVSGSRSRTGWTRSPSRSSIPSSGQEWLTSVLRRGARDARRSASPGGPSRRAASSSADGAVRTTLEHKLWFDELYDAVFSRPAQAIAVGLRDRFEGTGRPGWPRRGGRRDAPRRLRHLGRPERPAAHVRAHDHDLGRRSSPSSSWSCADAHDAPDLRPARRRAPRLDRAALAGVDGGARAARRARRGRPLAREHPQLRLLERPPAVLREPGVVRGARDLLRGRPLRLPVLARRPDGRRRARARSATARGRTATGRGRTSA